MQAKCPPQRTPARAAPCTDCEAQAQSAMPGRSASSRSRATSAPCGSEGISLPTCYRSARHIRRSRWRVGLAGSAPSRSPSRVPAGWAGGRARRGRRPRAVPAESVPVRVGGARRCAGCSPGRSPAGARTPARCPSLHCIQTECIVGRRQAVAVTQFDFGCVRWSADAAVLSITTPANGGRRSQKTTGCIAFFWRAS
jgi:hypothetical protein